METTKDVLRRLLAECLEMDVGELDDTKNLTKDIEIDSVCFLDYMIRIEENFNIEITEFASISHHMESVGSLLQYLCELIGRDEVE